MAKAGVRRRRRRSKQVPGRDADYEDLRALHLTTQRKRMPARGSSPGTLGELSGAPPRIELIAYSADSCECRPITDVEEIATLVKDTSRVCWIDVESFGDGKALARIGEILNIHPLAMADVVNVPQRPKADLYGDRLLLVTQMARLVEDSIDIEQVSIVFGQPGWVVTFQERPGDVFEPVRERLRAGARVRQFGADYLTYALLDAVIDGYFPVVESIGSAIEGLEDDVLAQPSRETLVRIHEVRRSLVSLHRILWRQRDAIGGLVRDTDCPFKESVKVYLRDAYDHAFQIVDAIDADRDLASGLMELYLSSASHRMNEVMKTLTLVATIFIPLTFVVGVYGMNFDFMPELHWRYGYYVVWAGMIALGGGLYWWFRRRGYLENQLEDDPSS
jgi:magnesium transporter